MQKVKLTYRTPVAKINKEGKAIIEFETKEENYIVASTKSYNNLIDDLKQENKIPTNSVITDLFISKENTIKAVNEFINAEIKDTEIAKFVAGHIIKALDGACVFKKPPVIRIKK